jgi:methyltransferase (TIGR00027 family)
MRADRPSATARLIGRSILLSAQRLDYRQLIPAGEPVWLKRILAACGRSSWFDFVLRHRWAAQCLWHMERAALPGIFLHYLARKRWIERAVGAALDRGADQVVVLGAGFDLLAWRHHRGNLKVLWCELDHPATQRPKAAALVPPGENFRLQPADLGHESPLRALQGIAGFDSQRPTCFVAEGLLMYFPQERVTTLLRELATGPNHTLAFSFMTPDAQGQIRFRGEHALIGRWLQRVREPFAWGIAEADLASFLAPLGWQLQALAGAAELRAEILAPARLADQTMAEGECLAVATTPR